MLQPVCAHSGILPPQSRLFLAIHPFPDVPSPILIPNPSQFRNTSDSGLPGVRRGQSLSGNVDGSCSSESGSSRVKPGGRLYNTPNAFDHPTPFRSTNNSRLFTTRPGRRALRGPDAKSIEHGVSVTAGLTKRMQSCHPACCIDCPSAGPNPLRPGIGRHVKVMPRYSGLP